MADHCCPGADVLGGRTGHATGAGAPSAHVAATQPAHQPEPPQWNRTAPAQTGVPAAGQPEPEHGAPEHGAEGEHGAAAEHAPESPWGLIARLFNFAILAGCSSTCCGRPCDLYQGPRRAGTQRPRRGGRAPRRRPPHSSKRSPDNWPPCQGNRAPQDPWGAGDRGRRASYRKRSRHRAVRLLEQTRREIDLHLRVAKRDLESPRRRPRGPLARSGSSRPSRRTISCGSSIAISSRSKRADDDEPLRRDSLRPRPVRCGAAPRPTLSTSIRSSTRFVDLCTAPRAHGAC